MTRLPAATHGHATIFFGMDRGGQSNGVRNAIELRIDVGKVRRRLLARGGRQVGVQFGLCAIYCGLSVGEGLGRIDRGSAPLRGWRRSHRPLRTRLGWHVGQGHGKHAAR